VPAVIDALHRRILAYEKTKPPSPIRPLDEFAMEHVRTANVRSGFYRRNSERCLYELVRCRDDPRLFMDRGMAILSRPSGARAERSFLIGRYSGGLVLSGDHRFCWRVERDR
jgi:hypothetical protein